MVTFDEEGFATAYRRHQAVSRAGKGVDVEPMTDLPETVIMEESKVGPVEVIGILRDGEPCQSLDELGKEATLVVERSVLHPPKGGQSSDIGQIASDDCSFIVTRVSLSKGVALNHGHLDRGRMAAGQIVEVKRDERHRHGIRMNHSATHLLHASLRELLGDSVVQAGSKVEADGLRFDFTHKEQVGRDTLDLVERRVFEHILANIPVTLAVMSKDEAKSSGALALFDDRYGDEVRVVSFGDVSRELCGGSHVNTTGDIGYFRIITEEAVGRGVRRINATTGLDAAMDAQKERTQLDAVARRLGVSRSRVSQAVEQLTRPSTQSTDNNVEFDSSKWTTLYDGTKCVVSEILASPKARRELALSLAKEEKGAVVLFSPQKGGVGLCIVLARSLLPAWDARDILTALIESSWDGRGGGAAHLVEAGGSVGLSEDALVSVLIEYNRIISAQMDDG